MDKDYDEVVKKEIVIEGEKEIEETQISIILARAFAVCLIAIVFTICYICIQRFTGLVN